MNKEKLLGYLLASLSSSLMASLGVFVRNISANELTIAICRFGLGFLFLCLYLSISQKIQYLRNSQFSFWSILSGIALAIGIVFYIKAMGTTSLANAVFLLYLGPLIATGGAAIWLGEKLTAVKVGLIGLAFLGCLLILDFKVSFPSVNAQGYGWGILSAFCYALFIVANQKISPLVPSLTRSFYQLLFGTLALIPFLILTDTDIELVQTDWYWLIGVGFFQGFLALTLAIAALQRLAAYEYGMIAYLEPLIATLIGWFVYAESVSLGQALGCAMILVAGLAQVLFSRTP
jgi:drug/metabolite transporter (DMT)-like permease